MEQTLRKSTAIRSRSTSTLEITYNRNGRKTKSDGSVVDIEEPQLDSLMLDVTQSFRNLSKKARKLERLTRRMKAPVSSEGYNYLLDEQIKEVNRTFETYMKRREEMCAYIKSTYWRSRFYGSSSGTRSATTENNQEVTIAELMLNGS